MAEPGDDEHGPASGSALPAPGETPVQRPLRLNRRGRTPGPNARAEAGSNASTYRTGKACRRVAVEKDFLGA